ncbi:MAG: abortive infection family protein [Oscillospiraceae bacterium]|nr:abortive infection family protein [Oscillospiraceae bacterium]
MANRNPYELLKTKEIYAILDGDTKYENYEFSDTLNAIPISMPYLSGSDLCAISTKFGLPSTYSWGGTNLSRWQYLDNLFTHCIKTNRCSDLLAYLFGKQQFSSMFSGHGADEIDKAYAYFSQTIIDKINGTLYFGGHELTVISSHFIVRAIGAKVEIQAPKINNVDRDYIKSISERAMEDIRQNKFDGAITKARTLLEEVFCYVIEKKNVTPSTSGNISELYKQVKDLYHMHGDANTDRRINTLLSGLEKIISSISEMRNKNSDAHGVGAARISIEEHHARLFVNASIAMADFILSVETKGNRN